jgi:hypothetical protein
LKICSEAGARPTALACALALAGGLTWQSRRPDAHRSNAAGKATTIHPCVDKYDRSREPLGTIAVLTSPPFVGG